MKISVINKKGGVGKTPLAFSIAKDLGLFLQSNDNSCIEKIYPNMAKIKETVANIDNCVFDFGGFVSHGVIEIIKNSNWVIIPCLPDYNSLLRTAETIKEIKENAISQNGYKNFAKEYHRLLEILKTTQGE